MTNTEKKIAWESWNAKVQEIQMDSEDLGILEDMMNAAQEEGLPEDIRFIPMRPRVLHTPYGPTFLDSLLKPSDRWDCWLCYANFDVTQGVMATIENVEGVEALKAMGRYTFFVGIGKVFNVSQVRIGVENALNTSKNSFKHTQEEVIEKTQPHLGERISLLKREISSSSYWTIFISPDGDVDHIMSDQLDENYLSDLGDLEELRSKFGGIILRSGNG
jgi:hypothetical protein|tara:strand:+ start:852 stop:1505 length:654 start_codon:yes stop_codon:yes gene_type:complete